MVSREERATPSAESSFTRVAGTSESAKAFKFLLPSLKSLCKGEAFSGPWIILSSSVGSASFTC